MIDLLAAIATASAAYGTPLIKASLVKQASASERVYYRFEEIGGSDDVDPVEVAEPVPSANVSDEGKRGFWRRQFSYETTPSQKRFDWLFGFYMPMICFYFDPIVFRDGLDDGLLVHYRLPAYLLGFVSTMGLTAWLLWGSRLKWANFWLGGLFLFSSIVSLALGIFLFPYSVMGSVFLIGILGFTPLVSAFTYFRNAVRALGSD